MTCLWRWGLTVLGGRSLSQQFWTWRTLTQKLWLLANCMDLPWSIQCITATGAGGGEGGGPVGITRNILSVEGGKYGRPFAEHRESGGIYYLILQRSITWCTITDQLIQGCFSLITFTHLLLHWLIVHNMDCGHRFKLINIFFIDRTNLEDSAALYWSRRMCKVISN